jgi:hypothetical protein
MDADIPYILNVLKSSHGSKFEEHIQLNGLRSSWRSDVFERDEPKQGVNRTGAVSLSYEEFLSIDDSTLAGLSSLFDGCRVWFAVYLPTASNMVVEDVLGKPWLKEPRIYLAPSDSGSGQVCVIRAKFDFAPGDAREACLPVALFPSPESIDSIALKNRTDSRMTVLRMSRGKGSRLPSRDRILSIIQLKSGLNVSGIEVLELGSVAEIETISRAQIQGEGFTDCCFYSVSSGRVMRPTNGRICWHVFE